MNNTYFIGDSHFFHRNIIEYGNRPFKDLDEMHSVLIKNWNNTVKKDSIIYHMGDFALGNNEQIATVFNSLNGRKRLILGNHDHPKKNFLKTLFEEVYCKPILLDRYLLSHHPIMLDLGSLINVHSHVHQNSLNTHHHANVSCEHINYTPVAFKNLHTLL